MSDLFVGGSNEIELDWGGEFYAEPIRTTAPPFDWAAIEHAYYASHVCCPHCRSDDIEVIDGMVWSATEPPFIDGNTVVCSCGWQGITDDLVPPKADWIKEGF